VRRGILSTMSMGMTGGGDMSGGESGGGGGGGSAGGSEPETMSSTTPPSISKALEWMHHMPGMSAVVSTHVHPLYTSSEPPKCLCITFIVNSRIV